MMQHRYLVLFFHRLKLFFFLGCAGALSACLDEISIDLPDESAGRLVIDGVVERSPDVYRFLVSVSRTQSLEAPVFLPEENVLISVLLNDSVIFDLPNGVPEQMPLEQFHSRYGIVDQEDLFNIRVVTGNGDRFESVGQSILQSPGMGSVSFELTEREELNDLENLVKRSYVKIKVNTPVINQNGDRLAMIWNASGVYAFVEGECTTDIYGSPRTCYVTERFNGTIPQVLQGAEVRGDQVEGFEVFETTASPQFAIGYYLTLVRRTVNGEAGLYWNEVRRSQQREGTIFDPPSGAIRSNIHQIDGQATDILGYFYTAGIDTLRQKGTRETGGSIRMPCAADPSALGCCYCLELAGSSFQKPPYWK